MSLIGGELANGKFGKYPVGCRFERVAKRLANRRFQVFEEVLPVGIEEHVEIFACKKSIMH